MTVDFRCTCCLTLRSASRDTDTAGITLYAIGGDSSGTTTMGLGALGHYRNLDEEDVSLANGRAVATQKINNEIIVVVPKLSS